MVEKRDIHGNFDDWDGGIHFKVMPEDDNEQFKKVGCDNHEFFRVKMPSSLTCPYHGPGGLKARWDKAGGRGNYKAEDWANGKVGSFEEKLRNEVLGERHDEKTSCCVVQ